jgi:hypothetical protein
MRRVGLRSRGWWAAIAVLVAVLVGGGWALAAGGSSSTIHACYAKRSGALRIAEHCRGGEKAISWGKVGPAGPAGAPGSPGAPGQPGAPGTARAYAYVNGSVTSPSFNTARTKGFSAVGEPAHGVYCLTAPGIDPATTAPAVTAVYMSAFAATPTNAKLESRSENCAAGQFEVLTEDINNEGHEINTPNLDFTIVVP